MKKDFWGRDIYRFSFRKLSIGLVSAAIGCFFLLFSAGNGIQSVHAQDFAKDESIQIQYKYVTESELTREEQESVIKEVPRFVEENSDTYYLVYRPKTHNIGVLPHTGFSGDLETVLSVSGVSLVILVIRKKRLGKHHLAALLMITSFGTSLLAPTVLAVTNIQLASYNQSLNLGIGNHLPSPLSIEGFEYIGYLKNNRILPQTMSGSRLFEDHLNLKFTNNNLSLQPKDRALKPAITSQKTGRNLEKSQDDISRNDDGENGFDVQISDTIGTEVVAYQTLYQKTDELLEGQTKVFQTGVAGSRKVVITIETIKILRIFLKVK